jgi:hypothetical protein
VSNKITQLNSASSIASRWGIEPVFLPQGLAEISNTDGHVIFRGRYYDSRPLQPLVGVMLLHPSARESSIIGRMGLAKARTPGGADEDRLIKLSPKIELRCRRAYEVFGTLGCLDCGTELTRPHNQHMRAEKTAQELICSPIG